MVRRWKSTVLLILMVNPLISKESDAQLLLADVLQVNKLYLPQLADS